MPVTPKAIRAGRIRVGPHTLLCYVLNDERRVLDAADLRGFFGFPDTMTQLALCERVIGRSNSTRSCITLGVMRPCVPRSRRMRP